MPRQDKVFVCFQKAEDDTHKLYIYDDVTAYGTFNWSTWSYEIIQTNITKEQISPKTSSFRGFLYIPINLSDTTKTHEISTVTNT